MNNDPLGLFSDDSASDPLGLFEDKGKTSFTEDNAIAEAGVKNTWESMKGIVRGGIATALGDTELADDYYRKMEATKAANAKAANPQQKEQGISGKVYGALSTLPAQLVSMPFSPFDTGAEMIEAGETTGKAQAGAGIDAAMNAVGMGVGGFGRKLATKMATSGAVNAAQDTATRLAISSLADQEQTKKRFAPSGEDAAAAGIVGAVFGAIPHGKKNSAAKDAVDGLSDTPPSPEFKPDIDLSEGPDFGGKTVNVDRNGVAYPGRIPELAETKARQNALVKSLEKEWAEVTKKDMVPLGPDADIVDKLKALNDHINAKEDKTARDKELADYVAKAHDRLIVDRLSRMNESLPDGQSVAATHDAMIAKRLQELDKSLPDDMGAYRKQLDDMQATDMQDKLGGLDDAVSGLEDREARLQNEDLINSLDHAERERGKNPIFVDPSGQAFRGDPGESVARRSLDDLKETYVREKTWMKELPTGEPLHGLRDLERQDAMKAARDERVGDLPKKYPDVNKAAIKKTGKPIDSTKKGGKQSGAIDLSVFREGIEKAFRGIEEAMRKIHIHPDGTSDAMDTMRDIYSRTENPEVVSFARKEYKALGYPFEVLAAFDKAIVAAHKLKLAQAEAKVIPFTRRTTPGGKQTGGATLDVLTLGLLPKKNPVIKALKKQRDGTYIPDDPTPEQLDKRLETARSQEDGKSLKNFDSGAALTAMKRGSEAIALAGEFVGNAFKRADLAIHKNVMPVEAALKKLNIDEIGELARVFKKEMFRKAAATPTELATLPVKMQVAYRKMREMFDDALRIQNEARAAKGQKPITALEAYLSSRWGGDFRRPLMNAAGKVVWYLAADTKAGLNAQTRAVLKDHPDLTYDPKKDHVVRFWNRKTDLESAYTTMLDVLGRDDPAVAKLEAYMQNQTVGEGATFLNQEKHFKDKSNVRGFIGDRPEIKVNDLFDRSVPFFGEMTIANGKKSEALAMFQQQIQYAKNAYRWSELQVAGQSLKKIINDPELVDKQPNNISYIRDYYKNAIGYGESKATRAVADSVRDVGISPVLFDKGIGGTKSFFILQKLAANVGFITAQGIQLSMTVPHLVDLFASGYRGNMPKAITAGLIGGLTMGSGHMFNALTGSAKFPDVKGFDFFNRAFKYAEDNGITARSIYDESPIESSFSKVGKVANGLGKTMTVPETYFRSVAFMTFSQFLKDSGKFKNEMDVFKEAERRTNVSMTDYAPTERPMVFSKLGTVGNFANTLQTYSWNFFNQYKYFYNEAGKGNALPLIAAIGMQYMVAGAMGVPFVEDIHDLWMYAKNALPAKQWKTVMDNDFLSNPKLWLLEHGGGDKVYGYLSDKSGIGLTSRVAAPTGAQTIQAPFGPAVDIAKQVGAGAQALADPTNTTKLAQSAMLSTPPGLQGNLETAPFMEGITHNKRPDGTNTYVRPTKLAEHEGLVNRTPADETLRKFGLRSQREVVEREVNYNIKRDEVTKERHTTELPKAFYDAVKRGDKADAIDYFKTYVYINGKGISKDQFNNMIQKEYLTDRERMEANPKKSVQSMLNLKRMEALFDSIEADHANK